MQIMLKRGCQCFLKILILIRLNYLNEELLWANKHCFSGEAIKNRGIKHSLSVLDKSRKSAEPKNWALANLLKATLFLVITSLDDVVGRRDDERDAKCDAKCEELLGTAVDLVVYNCDVSKVCRLNVPCPSCAPFRGKSVKAVSSFKRHLTRI